LDIQSFRLLIPFDCLRTQPNEFQNDIELKGRIIRNDVNIYSIIILENS